MKRLEDPVAQLVEQYTFNVWALGSSPSGITKQKFKPPVWEVFLCLRPGSWLTNQYNIVKKYGGWFVSHEPRRMVGVFFHRPHELKVSY